MNRKQRKRTPTRAEYQKRVDDLTNRMERMIDAFDYMLQRVDGIVEDKKRAEIELLMTLSRHENQDRLFEQMQKQMLDMSAINIRAPAWYTEKGALE